MEKAESGDTILLGEGNYTLYGISSDGTTKDKDLTFVGLGPGPWLGSGLSTDSHSAVSVVLAVKVSSMPTG